MGKTKKEQQEDIVVDTDPTIKPEFEKDDELSWDDMPRLREEVTEELLKQQAFILELAKAYAEPLKEHKEVYKFIEGLILSLKDLANQIVKLNEQAKGKTGVVNDIDDKLDYLNIATEYVNIQENIISLISNGYLEIVSSLDLNVDAIKEVIEKGKEDIKNVRP